MDFNPSPIDSTTQNHKRGLAFALGGTLALALAIFLMLRAKGLSAEKWAAEAPRHVAALLQAREGYGIEPLGAVKSVAQFYSRRQFAPAWIEPRSFKKELVPFSERLHTVEQEGLLPADYHAARITELRKKLSRTKRTSATAPEFAELDILLTDAYLLLATHFTVGKANPDQVETGGSAKVKHLQLTEALKSALDSNSVLASLDRRQRPEPAFQLLKKALDKHRQLAARGGWPMVPQGPDLKLGVEAERVGILKRRLVITGELNEKEKGEINRFDPSLHNAVTLFQRTHGQNPNGVVNAATLGELNVTVEDRIAQLQVNLERWRWIPRVMEHRYLLVNTTNYKVSLYEGGKPTLELRSIIGDVDTETPMFSDVMTYIVVNPAWNIPHKIATEEMLPKIKKNPGYLAKSKIEIFRMVAGKKDQVSPASVDWSSVTEQNFNFLLRQAPGAGNPLGAMKFVFPNSHAVYLHGTLNQKLFNKDVRAFSHGCIRIEKPLALAEALLRDSKDWDHKKLLSAIKSKDDLTIPLPTPIPVHIRYWTAWVSDDGVLQFRPDVYSWDRPLQKSLGQPVAATRLAD